MKKGLLIPDQITIDIWYEHITDLIDTGCYDPKKQSLLLDGIPRTVGQLKILESYIEVKKVILLEVKKSSILVERLQKRALIEKREDDQKESV